MNTLTATFSTGRVITRNSKKAFPFAWLAINTQPGITQSRCGFASTREGAERSAKGAYAGFSGTTRCEIVNVAA
jgi:hypothetical protein